MPIVYIHGVNVRSDEYWAPLEAMMRLYIAPVISKTPEEVSITHCYWGDVGAYFRFQGASMPSSPLNHWKDDVKGRVKADIEHVRSDLKKGRVTLNQIKTTIQKRKDRIIAYRSGQILNKLKTEGLSDLSVRVISASKLMSPKEKTIALQAADEAATDLAQAPELAACVTVEDEVNLYQSLLKSRYAHLRTLHGMPDLTHKPEWLNGFGSKIIEGLERYSDVPGFVMTRAAAEVRSPINTMVTAFIGDVFTYIRERGDWNAPGPIPTRALDALLAACEAQKAQQLKNPDQPREPLVVLSHSMGGQIVYDIVTHFLPNLKNHEKYKDIYIDFWCASASQVGFFEELKLFLASDEKYSAKSGQRVPRPDKQYLGYWWNVWDYNDFISYSAKNIFDEVEDGVYNTGMFLMDAHGGYLVRPSFFRQFAEKLDLELGKAGL